MCASRAPATSARLRGDGIRGERRVAAAASAADRPWRQTRGAAASPRGSPPPLGNEPSKMPLAASGQRRVVSVKARVMLTGRLCLVLGNSGLVRKLPVRMPVKLPGYYLLARSKLGEIPARRPDRGSGCRKTARDRDGYGWPRFSGRRATQRAVGASGKSVRASWPGAGWRCESGRGLRVGRVTAGVALQFAAGR